MSAALEKLRASAQYQLSARQLGFPCFALAEKIKSGIVKSILNRLLHELTNMIKYAILKPMKFYYAQTSAIICTIQTMVG